VAGPLRRAGPWADAQATGWFWLLRFESNCTVEFNELFYSFQKLFLKDNCLKNRKVKELCFPIFQK
jgi:hypothetical protein